MCLAVRSHAGGLCSKVDECKSLLQTLKETCFSMYRFGERSGRLNKIITSDGAKYAKELCSSVLSTRGNYVARC